LEIDVSRTLLAAAIVLLLTNTAPADKTAQAIIDRAIEAHGGKSNVAKLSTCSVSGEVAQPGRRW
jgi:hypothetical protein